MLKTTSLDAWRANWVFALALKWHGTPGDIDADESSQFAAEKFIDSDPKKDG